MKQKALAVRILVIEDSDSKFSALSSLINEEIADALIIRAPTVVEAEEAVFGSTWSLVILDISMDIAPSKMGHRSRGQANIGGLGIAQKMFLMNREFPTIIVTAFDAFRTSHASQAGGKIVGFEEIERRAKQYLSESLVACLQYNSSNWKSAFRDAVRTAKAL